MNRPKVVLDCDPGIDDAFAIMCALRFCELEAVTTVSGNVPVQATTRNALYLLELAGRSDIPVFRGAEQPLRVPPAFADDVHGSSGLGAAPAPTPGRGHEPGSAVDALAHLSSSVDAVIATGPLTNIAALIEQYPHEAASIPVLHWMGGSTSVGNITNYGEFNAWADPHAVDVVFGSAIPVIMYGLQLTHQVRMTDHHVDLLVEGGSATAIALADFLRFYTLHGAKDGLGQPMHDPCAVLGATHATLFSGNDANMVVITADSERRGQTVPTNSADADSHTIHVVDCVDDERVLELIIEAATEPGLDVG